MVVPAAVDSPVISDLDTLQLQQICFDHSGHDFNLYKHEELLCLEHSMAASHMHCMPSVTEVLCMADPKTTGVGIHQSFGV